MSIAHEISRITAAKSALKTAINARGGALTTELLDDYAAAVTALPAGSGENTLPDLSFVTAAADDILAGKTGTDKSGDPVYGNIQTVTAGKSGNVVTIPKGYIATAQILTIDAAKAATVSGNVVTVYPGYTATQYTATVAKATSSVSGNAVIIPAGYHDETVRTIPEAHIVQGMHKDGNITTHTLSIDAGYIPAKQEWSFAEIGLSGINAAADRMLAGTVSLDADGNKITGNIPTVTAVRSGNTVTIPKGYIAASQSFNIGGSVSGGSMDFYKCAAVHGPRKVSRIKVENAGTTAVNGDYEKTSLTTSNGGEVWKHLTADCYLYNLDGYWCIDHDYATWGENALYYTWNSDMTDWCTGYNYDTGGSTGSNPAPAVSKILVTLDADVPETWDGYKAILADGVYDFEKTLTTGLSYGSALIPAVGNVYSADASVKAVLWLKPLYTPDDSTVAYISFDDGSTTDLTGHLTNSEKGSESDGFNNGGWSFGGGYIQTTPDGSEFVFGTEDFTMEAYIYPVNTDRQCIFAYENDYVFAVAFSYSGSADLGVFYPEEWSNHVMSDNPLTLNQWHHVAFVRKAGELSLWINGEKQSTTLDLSGTNVGEAGQKFGIGRWGGDPGDFNKRWQGNMDEVRISNIARYE